MEFTIIEGSPKDRSGTYVGWDDCDDSFGSLWTDGIGPCLAIALYAPETKKGALAHISGVRGSGLVPEAAYPENIVNTLISKLGVYKQLEAVLAGESHRQEKISPLVKRDLAKLNIPIIGEDLGDFGTHLGRAVYLDCNTETVQVYRLPSLLFQ